MARLGPKPLLLFSLAIAINFIWAVSYPLSKEIMATIPPLTLSLMRMLGGAVVLLPLYFFRKKKPLLTQDLPTSLKDWCLLAMMGLLGCGLSTLLQFEATTLTLASNISLIVCLETISVMMLAAVFLKEKINRNGWIGALLALLGAALISIPLNIFEGASSSTPSPTQSLTWPQLQGNFLMICSVFLYAVYTIAGKTLAGRISSLTLTAFPFLIAILLLAPLTLLLEPSSLSILSNASSRVWLILFLISFIGSGVTFLIWNWLIQFMDASSLSRSLYFQPLAGVVLSAWILGERLAAQSLIGAALLIVGVLLSERKPKLRSTQN